MLRGVVSGTYWSVVCRWGRTWDASWASGLGIRWIQVSSVKTGERGRGTGFVGKVITVDIVEKKVFLFLKVVESPLTLSCSLYSKINCLIWKFHLRKTSFSEIKYVISYSDTEKNKALTRAENKGNSSLF